MNGNYTNYVHENLPFDGHNPMTVAFKIKKTSRTFLVHKAMKIGTGVSTVIYSIRPF